MRHGLVLLGVLLAVRASATEFFASPSGNDANPGTQVLPFRTLAKGVSVLAPGDTLTLRAGSYQQAGTVFMETSGTAPAPIRVRGFAGETATIRSTTLDPAIETTASHLVFEDLVFDGSGVGLEGIVASFDGGARSDHLVVRRCTFRGHRGSGLRLVPADFALVEDSLFENNGTGSLDHGIYVETGDGIVVRRSTFRGNAGWGIQLYCDSGTLPRALSGLVGGEGLLVAGNRTSDNGAGGIVVGGDFVDVVVENNLVHANALEGIAIDYSDFAPAGTIVRHNTVFGNGPSSEAPQIHVGFASATTVANNVSDPGAGAGYLVSLDTSLASGTIFRSNLYAVDEARFLVDFVDRTFAQWTSATGETGAAVGDPAFGDAASDDFHLASGGSAAIDLGSGAGGHTTNEDFDGDPRPFGAAPDAGADERVAAGPNPAAASGLDCARAGTLVACAFTIGGACATDHVAYSGPLASVSSYGWNTATCALGTSGSATFDPGSGNRFFVIVGRTAVSEGSYGVASGGTERPEASGLGPCDLPQALAATCP